MNEDAKTSDTSDISLAIPFTTIASPSVPSRNASSPIDTSSEEVSNAAPTLFQGLLSLENARVPPMYMPGAGAPVCPTFKTLSELLL